MSLPPDERIAVVTNIGLITPTSLLEGSSVRSNAGEVLVELVPKDQRSAPVQMRLSQVSGGRSRQSAALKNSHLIRWQEDRHRGQMWK